MPHIGAYAAVRIRYQGETFDMWSSQLNRDLQGVADDFGVGPWVTSVTVQLNGSTANQISVTMEAPYEKGLRLLESGLFTLQNVMLARVGYSKGGFMSPWYACILSQPNISFSPGGLSINLVGQGAGSESMLQGSGKSWGPTTRWDVVRAIAKKYRLQIFSPDDTARQRLSEQTDFSRSQAGINDWLFLRQICEEVGIQVTGTTHPATYKAVIQLADIKSSLAQQPKRTFVAMGNFDLERNRYPIISFTSETPPGDLFANAAMKGVTLGRITDRGEEEHSSLTVGELQDASLAEGSLDVSGDARDVEPLSGLPDSVPPDAGGEDDQGAGVVIADSPLGAGDFMASTLRTAQLGFPGVRVNLATVGIPFVQPYEIFEVRGLSALFDGKYLSVGVTHIVNTGGFETQVVGLRNALGIAPKVAQNVNRTKPAEDGESVSVR